MQLLGFKDYRKQSTVLANLLGIEHLGAPFIIFPSVKVTLPNTLDAKIIFCRSLDHPSNKFDRIITLYPHLHRIDNLNQAIPNIEAISLSTTQLRYECLSNQCI